MYIMNVVLIIFISIFMFVFGPLYKPSWLAGFLTLGIVCNECHYLDWTINYLSTTTIPRSIEGTLHRLSNPQLNPNPQNKPVDQV